MNVLLVIYLVLTGFIMGLIAGIDKKPLSLKTVISLILWPAWMPIFLARDVIAGFKEGFNNSRKRKS